MKTTHYIFKNTILALASFLCLALGISSEVKAQGFTIDAYDSVTTSPCAVPLVTDVTVYGSYTASSTGNDSIAVYINFGDGNNTTLTGMPPMMLTMGNTYNYSVTVPHTYFASGTYTLQYTATNDSGVSVSLLNDQVIVGCSNSNLQIQNLSVTQDSTNYQFCSVPAELTFMAYGYHFNTTFPDTIQFSMNFGDGLDTTFQYIAFGSSFYPSFNHTYYSAGSFSVQLIAIANNGDGDTLELFNQVQLWDSCGNINGKVYVDANANCVFDGGETPLASVPVQLLNGTTVVNWSYTDANGDYYFDVPVGPAYTIQLFNGYWSGGYATICPNSGIYSVSAPASGNNFALNCSNGFDLTGYLSTWGFVPNQNSYAFVSAYNLRCLPTSGSVSLTLDPLVSFVSSNPAPASISGSTLTWNFSNLSSTAYSYWWNSLWSTAVLHTSSSATIGDSVCFTLTVNPIAGDEVPANNTKTICKPILSSYDPNMKEVSPAGVGISGDIPADDVTPMEYTVHFQNTGTYTAFNIFILDTLDTDLDETTFHVLASSHAMKVDILPGNVIKFAFNNILLPDSGSDMQGSNGFVKYSIQQNSGLAIGTQIMNTAGIYFDFNEPVITNTTLNTIADFSGIRTISTSFDATLYPNPASSSTEALLNLDRKTKLSYRIINPLGAVVASEVLGEKEAGAQRINIETGSISSGIYFVEFKTNDTRIVKKLTIVQ